MSEPTTEELVQICKDFMLNAPPGEFLDVVADIRGLLSDESIINDIVPTTFKQYNTEQMISTDNGDHKVLICPQGELNGNEYIDPQSKQIITFDHITHEITSTRDGSGELDSDVESFREELQKSAEHYTSEHYKWGTTGVYSAQEGGNYVLNLAISSAKFEPKNYWTGRWRSSWKVVFPSGGNGNATLTGKVQIKVHYYEDANVQLDVTHDLSTTSKGGKPAELAKFVIEAIKKAEHNYHDIISENINNMNSSSYKSLRRQLPITGSLVDWDKIGNLKMGGK
eukprot:TRINITY_DN15050_c0_g1_i1.p1 TRINITY_DN15050_c0_g1~~TRINITY_DN15050_c0_g1_i1.p1  ORF type:complete len:282 (+),score=87.94 TRINITY_DN15050_c0_g1_i1:51-896(+)